MTLLCCLQFKSGRTDDSQLPSVVAALSDAVVSHHHLLQLVWRTEPFDSMWHQGRPELRLVNLHVTFSSESRDSAEGAQEALRSFLASAAPSKVSLRVLRWASWAQGVMGAAHRLAVVQLAVNERGHVSGSTYLNPVGFASEHSDGVAGTAGRARRLYGRYSSLPPPPRPSPPQAGCVAEQNCPDGPCAALAIFEDCNSHSACIWSVAPPPSPPPPAAQQIYDCDRLSWHTITNG